MILKMRNQSLAALLAACATITSSHAATLVTENFGGLVGNDLNGTTADTFDPALITASGSATWLANTTLKADGSVNGTIAAASAYLDLGSYVNSAKNTATGKFTLTTTISTTAGNWLSLGFSGATNVNANWATTGNTLNGYGNILVRLSGDIDQFKGLNNSSELAVDNVIIGNVNQTVTVTLDFTPSGGYNGTNNFGNVVFSVSGAGGYTTAPSVFTADAPIRYIDFGWGGGNSASPALVTGSYAALSLSQIPELSAALLGGLGLLGLLRRRR